MLVRKFVNFALLHMIQVIIAISDESKLMQHLLVNYDKLTRPVYNYTGRMDVGFGLALVQILDVDGENDVLTTSMWHRYEWKDVHLTWKPKDFGKVNEIRLPIKKIWSPDISMVNSAANDQLYSGFDTSLAVVHSDGTVRWQQLVIQKSLCVIDLTYFPYDKQECSFRYVSMTYGSYKMDLQPLHNYSRIYLTEYFTSSQWTLMDTTAKRYELYKPCCVEPNTELIFNVTISRRPGNYRYNTVLPTAILTLLTVLMFWLPPSHQTKLNIGLALLIAYLWLVLTSGRKSMNIATFNGYGLCLVTLSLILTVITINIAEKITEGQPVSGCVRKTFINWIGGLLCVSRGNIKRNVQDEVFIDEGWKTLATVLDRIFFVVYMSIIVTFVIICFT